jgi:hypothetical protein
MTLEFALANETRGADVFAFAVFGVIGRLATTRLLALDGVVAGLTLAAVWPLPLVRTLDMLELLDFFAALGWIGSLRAMLTLALLAAVDLTTGPVLELTGRALNSRFFAASATWAWRRASRLALVFCVRAALGRVNVETVGTLWDLAGTNGARVADETRA